MEVLRSSSPKRSSDMNETKVKSVNMNKVISVMFRDWSITINNAYHKGGRVWVLWKPQVVDIIFLEYDAQYIHMMVTDKLNNNQFAHTLVYAFNGVAQRESLWANLSRIASSITGPWAIGGDFNYVLQAQKRLGGNVTVAESEPFQNCLDVYGMIDIQATGAYYTWSNKQPPETRVYSRLDRFLVYQDWMRKLPDYFAHFPPERMFDHNPCLSSAPGFLDCVQKVWAQRVEGTKMYEVVSKLKALKPELKRINRDHFSDIENNADIA
ncbi:uncharacterized protein LOC141649700 [Silene latifolia]|uniref:uncharacterized protein LOC141649700 n=1 Tax=Silene latifolia TaxID=37657 RepID=UPI003D76B9F7